MYVFLASCGSLIAFELHFCFCLTLLSSVQHDLFCVLDCFEVCINALLITTFINLGHDFCDSKFFI